MIPKRIFTILIILPFIAFALKAQLADTIDLFQCYKLVRSNAPQRAMLGINNNSTHLEVQKINSNNLPNVTGYGKAFYQSDAIAVPAAGMEIDRFQYNAGVNVDQKLFDGGLVAIQRDIKQIEGEIKNLETETSLYKYNELVNKYFFGIISMQKSIDILMLRISTLDERKKTVASGVQNGMVLKSELDRLEAEILTSNQQITEIKIAINQMENNLKVLAGVDKNSTIIWKVPEVFQVSDSVKRIEYELYNQNRERADAMIRLQNKRYIPKLYAYGQAGYSYPGLNFFENEPAAFYVVGAKLSWQIFDWQQAKKDKQLIGLQKEQIDIFEADFNRNLSLLIDAELEELNKLQQLLDDDQKIIAAKESVTKSSSSALDNGTITTADYLNDLNSELRARFDFERHKISLSESTARLAVLKGINVEQL